MNLPVDFEAQTRSLLGNEEYEMLVAALEKESPVSIRLNPSKPLQCLPTDKLAGSVPWCSDGYYLGERLTFTFDPLFHAGAYYVQEASSMFLEQAVKQYISRPTVALDLCAAPGGKSTHLRSLLPEGSLLVANEVIRSRSQILSETLTKWGHPDVMVTNNDPESFSSLTSCFDLIVADVPCSGEGMFRKDPGAVTEWSVQNVEICSQRQRRIIGDVWPALAPGGVLIYSTCTYNSKENEENVAWMIKEFGAEVLPLDIPAEWHVAGNQLGADFPVYRFLPHYTKGEGFFMAVIRKPDGEDRSYSFRDKNKKMKIDFPKAWLKDAAGYQPFVTGSSVSVVKSEFAESVAAFQQKLKVLHCGIVLGEAKGKDFIPAHALAMSNELNHRAFPRHELTLTQAIAYLRKEALSFDASVEKGHLLLTYKDLPLGFVKNIGNRANNLYPQEWRIRSGYLPEELKVLD